MNKYIRGTHHGRDRVYNLNPYELIAYESHEKLSSEHNIIQNHHNILSSMSNKKL